MARAHFYYTGNTTMPATLDLESSATHIYEARKERRKENCESIDILIELSDVVPAVRLRSNQTCNLLSSQLDNAENTVYNQPSDR